MIRSRLTNGAGAVIAPLSLVTALSAAALPTALAAGIDRDTVPMTNGVPSILNNWDCRSAKHSTPVIMVHGTFSSQLNQIDVTDMLHKQGYCVFGTNIGYDANNLCTKANPNMYGTADINRTTDELNAFIKKVKSRTGAKKVDLIGHSQGALLIRNRITRYGGKDVRVAMFLAGTHHGSTMSGAQEMVRVAAPFGGVEISDAAVGPAVGQQMVGSSFMTNLNRYPDTVPGVTYVVVVTPDDMQATPWSAGFITKPVPGARVYNINVKELCNIPATEIINHSAVHIDPRALRVVSWGIGHSTEAHQKPQC